jgi:hypothetical protein
MKGASEAMAENERNGVLLPLGFLVGGTVGVILVRILFLDSIETLAWSMFWSSVGNGQLMDMGTVLRSATFAKCVSGFLVAGVAAALAVRAALRSNKAGASDFLYQVNHDGTSPAEVPEQRADLLAGASPSIPADQGFAPAPTEETVPTSAAEQNTETNSAGGAESGIAVGRRYAARRAAMQGTSTFSRRFGAAPQPGNDLLDERVKPCARCGQQNPEDYNFCMKCGEPFNQPAILSPSEEPHRSASSGQLFNQPDLAITLEEPHRRTSMIDQQMRSFDKTRLTTQQKLYFQQEYDKQSRNPSTALVLALLLGGLGAHRFYLREMGWGVAYIVFCWTFIPVLVSFVECFFIRSRTRKFNERCAEEILAKMAVIFSEPEMAPAVR